MTIHQRWQRKPESRRNRLRRSSSVLAIEVAEPRLLLSAGVLLGVDATAQHAAANAVINAIEANLDKLGHALGSVEEGAAAFDHALPFLSTLGGNQVTLPTLGNLASASPAADKVFDLNKLVQDNILKPLQDHITATDINTFATTGDIADALQAALRQITAFQTVTVTDQSTSKDIDPDPQDETLVLKEAKFTFSAMTLTGTPIDFVLDLNSLLGNTGLVAPVNHGNITLSEQISFQTSFDVDTLAFSLIDPTAKTTFSASATIPGTETMSFGLLSLQVTSPAVLSYSGDITIGGTGSSLTDVQLTSLASSYSDGVVPVGLGTNSAITLTVPLSLSQDVLAIPGFTSTSGSLVFTGNVFGDPLHPTNLNSNLTLTFAGFDNLAGLASMSPNDLLSVFSNVGGYINQLSNSALMNIEFPFTNGATVGDVINFAAQFKADIIDKLGPVDKTIGIDYAHQAATAATPTSTAVISLTPADLSHDPLPANFRIEIDVNGHPLFFDIVNPSTNPIDSVSDLKAAIDLALPAALAGAGLSSSTSPLTIALSGNQIVFTALATNTDPNPPPNTPVNNPASISVHTTGASFYNLVTFAKNLASVLGYKDLAAVGTAYLSELLSNIGIHFDPVASTLEFQLDYSVHLPAGLSVLGFDGASRIGTVAGSQVTVSADLPASADFTRAFAFNVVINNHAVEIDLAPDAARDTAAELVSAISAALHATTINKADFALSTTGSVLLDTFVSVSSSTTGGVTTLIFTGSVSALTPTHPVAATPLLALSDVHGMTFSADFDLGDLGGLTLKNGIFSFDATAGMSMTVGITVPSLTAGTTVDHDTPLDALPIWPAGVVTADQLNGAATVARSALGLSGTGVISLGDFLVASIVDHRLVLTANEAAIQPTSLQTPTIVLQDPAVSPQLGLAALGFAAGQSAIENAGHTALVLTGTTDVSNFTSAYAFTVVVNGHAVTIGLKEDAARNTEALFLAAINNALAPVSGFPDMKIYLRDGTTATIEFQTGTAADPIQHLVVKSGATTIATVNGSGTGGKIVLDDLITALNDTGVTADYVRDPNTNAILSIEITDGSTPQHLGPGGKYLTPETLGFAINQSAVAKRIDPNDPNNPEYQAVLTADVSVLNRLQLPSTVDYGQENAFLLTLGTLDPVMVHVAASAGRSATDFVTALNAALDAISIDPTTLGLPASHAAIHLGDLVQANVVSGLLTLTTTMHEGVPEISVNSTNSTLRAAANFGLSISTVDLRIWATNGSHLATALGIASFDQSKVFAGGSGNEAFIDSAALRGGSLLDRIFIDNASMYGDVHLNVSGDMSATLGFLSLSAKANADIYLKTSLSLENPDGGTSLTFQTIANAFTNGTVADLWSFDIGSGNPGQPWAALTISHITIDGSTALNHFGDAIAGNGTITIALDGDLHSLGDFLLTRPVVTYTGFNLPDLQSLSFSKIVSGIETVLKLLDNSAGTDVLTTPIPLIGVNLESILHFADSIAGFVDELQNQPASAIDKVSKAIQDALGTTAVSLVLSGSDLLLNFNIKLVDVNQTLPVSLDLKALAAAAGVDLPDGVADLASASGMLAITAGATFGISLGIRVAASPATTTSPLASLNKGAGVAGDGTAAPDLGFVLGNGRTFAIDLDGLGSAATVGTLLNAINTAATAAGVGGTFATFVNGQFVFSDTSTVVTAQTAGLHGLGDLGFASTDRVAPAPSGNVLSVMASSAASDPASEFAFRLLINGHAITVHVAAETGRDAAGLLADINDALAQISVDRSSLDLTGSGQVSLDHLVTASAGATGLKLSATIADIASTVGVTSFGVQDLKPGGLAELGVTGPITVGHAGGVQTISTTLPNNDGFGAGYRFDVVLNGQAVTVDVPENGARTTGAALAAAIDAALGNTLVDRSAIGLSGSGKVSVGQLITVSQVTSGSPTPSTTLTFTASDAKLGGSSSTFTLQDSTATPPKLAFEVVDLNNSGGAAKLGLGNSGALGLKVLGPGTSSSSGGNLSVTLTPPAGTDFSKAYAFDLVIDGHPVTVQLAADANRIDLGGMAKAINAALAKISADRAEFGLNGAGTTTFDKIITATSSGGQLTLTGKAADLAPVAANATLAIKDIAVTASSDAGSNGAARTLTGSVLDVEKDDDRFFVNTNAPDAPVDPGSGIVVTFGVAATDLTFNTSFGPLSASIKGGTATLGAGTDGNGHVVGAQDGNGHVNPDFVVNPDARVGVGLDDGDGDPQTTGHLSFTTIANTTDITDLFAVQTNVAINVKLPVFVVGISIGDVVIKISDILETNHLDPGTSIYVALPTNFADQFNAFEFLNNPQAVINGLDALLAATDALFHAQVFGFKLPLIGDALSSAGDFVGDLRSNIIGYLQGLVNDYEALHPGKEPTTASIISDGLSALLTTLDFGLPQFIDPSITAMVMSKVDPEAETIMFDLNIEKVLFHGSVDLSADLGIPGLGINISNGRIDLDLTLDLSLQFGYAATGPNRGFFFLDTLAGSHALALKITAAPQSNFNATASLGIVTLSATNPATPIIAGGTALTGGVYVDLHPKTTANLSDLGFTKNSLDNGDSLVVTAALAPTLDKNTAIAFRVEINGTDFLISIPGNPNQPPLNPGALAAAINAAMDGINVDKSLIGQSGGGTVTLGSLVDVTAPGNKLTFTASGLGANGHFAVEDVPLSTSDVPKSLRVSLQADANLDLMLNANLDLGTSIQLPSVSTELVFSYHFAKLMSGFDDGTFENHIARPLSFVNVTLDVGSFLSDFLEPILDIAWDIIGPVKPILDFVTSPLPGISDLMGSPTSLIDLAQLLGGDNPEVRSVIAAVQVLNQVADLIETIHNMGGGSLVLNFGTYVFGEAGPGEHSLTGGSPFDPFSSSVKSTKLPTDLENIAGTKTGASAGATKALTQLNSLSQTTVGNGKMSLPILENPIGALKLLTGQIDAVDLFTWQLPTFAVGISGGKSFPVVGIPGIGLSAGLNVNFGLALNVKFGYDTLGFVEFQQTNNPVYLLDGFYVDNTLGPQLTMHFGVGATASLDLFLAKAGVTGEVNGDFRFTLLDPNEDGRVRPTEILETLLHDPLHIFVIDGAITANVRVWWWVGIDTFLFGTITLYSDSVTLVDATLVTFHYAPDPLPILATKDSSRALNIDMGPLASQRAHAGDNVDGNEWFEIIHRAGGSTDHENVTVVYHYSDGTNYSRDYDDISMINLDGGVGDNKIVMNGIQSAMTINAGNGNNIVDLTGGAGGTVSTGKATINLGDGNNTVTGGTAADTITVGDGNNLIYGGDGNDVITAGAGANFINGSGAGVTSGTNDKDQITVGGGRNVVIGGMGDDTIKSGDGGNIVFGGVADADTETALKNALEAYRALTSAQQQAAPAFSTLTTTLFANGTADGDNVIRLGGGNNIIFGGAGGDTITAGSGSNIVLADVGIVQLANGVLVGAATTDGNGAALTNGGADTVRLGVGTAANTQVTVDLAHLPAASGSGNQIILGGAGSDILVGTNGTNIIIGDLGSVDGPARGTPQFTITTIANNAGTDGADGIVGGVNADVLFGGGGDDVINAGPGNDIVAGDRAVLVRTTAVQATATLISFQSLDEFDGSAAGADTIDGSTGNDLIIGGGGADIISGGSGNNTLLGDFGIIVPAAANGSVTDVLGRSTSSSANGNDTISATNGYNVIMGGGGGDTINAGDGTNVVFGDNGAVNRSIDANNNLIPVLAAVVDQSFGGNDIITSGRGNNIIMGGAGDDHLTAGGGNNVLLGDFGTYRTPDGTNPDIVGTDTSNAANGQDTITVSGGNNVAMGGGGADIITAEKPDALYDLGFDLAHRTGVDNGTAFVITATLPALTGDALKAFVGTRYQFDIVINGHEFLVDVGSDTGRTSYADLKDAINTALSKITPLKSDLGLSGGGTVKLSQFVTVATDGTHLTFTALDGAIAPISGAPGLALRDAPSVNVLFGDSGVVLRDTSLALKSANTKHSDPALDQEAFGGNDTITLNYGTNVAFGGAGADSITVHGIGANIGLGDNGEVTITPNVVLGHNTGAGGNDIILIDVDATGDNIVMGGVGSDTITIAGSGNNVALGDSGEINRDAVTLAFISADTADTGATLDESVGGDDSITVETTANANNVLIGGAGADTLTVKGTGKNIVIGDAGAVTAATLSQPDIVTAHNLNVGGADIITVAVSATGANILIGGAGDDQITINGTGGNVAFGDGGIVRRAAGTLALISAETVEQALGGKDTLTVEVTGSGDNILIGGTDDDSITIKGDGRNMVLGDLGIVTAATSTDPDTVQARDTTIGGIDTITVTADAIGANILMGGALGDILTIDGAGDNILFGDSGLVLRAAATLAFLSAETVEETIGGADQITINGGGANIALGGTDSDTIRITGTGNNIALGDLGLVRAIDGINPDVVGRNTAVGAADQLILTASATGNNILMGEAGDEDITSDGPGFNIIFGDTGEVTRTPTGALVSVVSVDPSLGGADTIVTHAGSNIVFGGAKGDNIQTSDGIDYIVGDNGAFTYLDGVRSELKSTDFTEGGNDTINAGGGENYVIGGTGDDMITGNAGDDIVVGDQGIIAWDAAGTLTRLSSLFDPAATEGVDTILVGDGSNKVIGGGKGDTITTGSGVDYVVGDNGFITFSGGILTQVSSADPSIAGDDTINAGEGDNYVIGGGGSDGITTGAGLDYLIGDNGLITFVSGIRTQMSSSDPAVAGDDTIAAGDGENYVIGGGGSDGITTGFGNDSVIADNGIIDFAGAGVRTRMTSTDFGVAGNDTVNAGAGDNVVIGGGGNDTITTGAGLDIIVGDHGEVTWSAAGVLQVVTSLLDSTGTVGSDTIVAGDGTNYVIGGGAGDTITTGSGADSIIADNGSITLTAGIRTRMVTLDFGVAGDDTVNAGEGDNVVIGDGGNDTITTGAGLDIIVGDHGEVTWSAAGVLQVVTSLLDSTGTVGSDTIVAGDGTNYVIGGGAGDTIQTGSGTDYILGDNGSIVLVAGIRSIMTTADFAVAGDDGIVTGDGENYAFGGAGADLIIGGSGRDQLVGDEGFMTWNADGTRHELSSLLSDTAGTAGSDTINGGDGNDNIIGGLKSDALSGEGGNDIIIGDDGHVVFDNDQESMAETLDQFHGDGDVISGGSGNNFLFGGQKNNLFFADPLQDLIVIMDGHADISPDRKVTINIPPQFGDGLLTPLGQSLMLSSPFDEAAKGSYLFSPVKIGGETDLFKTLFGDREGTDAASAILAILGGQPKSAFNLSGLLSSNIVGTSLLNLLAIGPTSLIESVTVGDILPVQQDAGDDVAQASGDHGLPADPLAAEPVRLHDEVPAKAASAIIVDFAPAAEPVAAMVFDEERGQWIADTAAAAGPRLILKGTDLPRLDLSSEMTMAA